MFVLDDGLGEEDLVCMLLKVCLREELFFVLINFSICLKGVEECLNYL